MNLLSANSSQEVLELALERYLPPVCPRPDTLQDLPGLLTDRACLQASLSLVIGTSIVLFAGFIKLPQIATILSNKSVQGLVLSTFLIETFGYSYNFAMHYRQNYLISTYGDFFVLIFENYVILYLCYSYTERSRQGIAVVIIYFASLLFMCSPYFPLQILEVLTLGNVAVVVMTRVPQIYANYKNGSTGALSSVTCWGIFFGASARIFTTVQNVNNINILAGYLTSAFFNGILAFQVLYYGYIMKTRPVPEKTKKTA